MQFLSPYLLSGKTVDMWSIGVITYTLLGGYPPFHDDNMKNLFKKIRRGDYKFHPKYWDKVSPEAKDLIKGLLNVDTSKRLTAEQVLIHPWLKHDDEILFANNLEHNFEEFKKYHQSRIKFKGAVRTVIMLNRLNKIIGKESLASTGIRTESIRATGFELLPEHIEDENSAVNECAIEVVINDDCVRDGTEMIN